MTAPARLAAALSSRLKGSVATDVPLSRMTTYRLGGPAAVLAEPAGMDDLVELASALADEGDDVDVVALGRGSNLVVSDDGFQGVVVHLGSSFSWVRAGATEGSLVAGAATPLPVVASRAARRGLGGLEFLVAVPGSVGGGVRMNAGAHGAQVGDHLDSATVFDLGLREVTARPAPTLGLGYRRSNLTDREVVVEARFSLAPAEEGDIKARMDAYRRHRAETQPGAVQNAGSVFRNPPGGFAGRLVESCGLKGFRVGGARVSELHANFFIAEEGATSQDVYDLVREVRARVRTETGVDLHPEIRFLGAFEHAARARGGGAR